MSDNSPLYAAIDLGSNSFHMLVVNNVEGAVRAVSRVKRKVRLADGLDENFILSEEAILRGLDCLRLFSEQLKDIPKENVRIVGTAALRLAKNSNEFCERAEKILNNKIDIISGEQEAKTIYDGVLHTTSVIGNVLVIDIGGASTELILGNDKEIFALHSTSMGCVTWLNFFEDNGNKVLTSENFEKAINASKNIIKQFISEYSVHGFNSCVGASGTVQALQEIMIASGMNENVTYEKLQHLKNHCIKCGNFSNLEINGLTAERLNVFPSGLSILIAIFEMFSIKSMNLAGGALREGLIYGLLGNDNSVDARLRTIKSLINRYQLDYKQGKRVSEISLKSYQVVKNIIHDESNIAEIMLESASLLYELGLCIEYKKAPYHAAYIIENIDMPGFSPEQKKLLSALVINQRDDIKLDFIQKQHVLSVADMSWLIRILRIAIIICIRRSDNVYKDEINFELKNDDTLVILVPKGWLEEHYLRYTLLSEEINKQLLIGWKLELVEYE